MQQSISFQDTSFYVSTADLNLRSGPGTTFDPIGIINEGDTVQVLGATSKYWVRLNFKGLEGYSAGRFLEQLIIAPAESLPPEEKSDGNSGILFLLAFCVVLILVIRKVTKKKKGPVENTQRQRRNPTQVTPKITVSYGSDNSIIDVNEEDHELDIGRNYSSFSESTVPYWSMRYVYSHDELKYANREQRKFYYHLKEKVLKGEFVDIDHNTNYAFILYFDLLEEYKSHKDVQLLEEQFNLIGEICPKTIPYSLYSLKNKLSELDTQAAKEKLELLEDPTYLYEQGYADYDPDMYKLGTQYKKKLGLKKSEIKWLNKFYNPSNVFISIEGCCIAVIKVYLSVIKELNKKIIIGDELERLFEKAIDIERLTFSGYDEAYERKWAYNRFQECFFLTTFKRIENEVREQFGHKRKLSFDPYAPYTVLSELVSEKSIDTLLDDLIESHISKVPSPGLDTQKELNAQNVNRWKPELDEIKKLVTDGDLQQFHEALIRLEESNEKNAKIESVFIDAAKFLAKLDAVSSLKNYTKYVFYNSRSKYKKVAMPAMIKKHALGTEDRAKKYEQALEELERSNNIQDALALIDDLFVPKRKAIKLDKSEIENVKIKHQGTVGLLSKYLEADESPAANTEPSPPPEPKEVTASTATGSTPFIVELGLTDVQITLIERIASNSFSISQLEVEQYAADNAMFKNQLVDSINETCEAYLDGDPLIEEEDDLYVIEESYYQEIVNAHEN